MQYMNELNKLERFLKTHFPKCPLMPSSKEKCPSYKHAGVPANTLWETWQIKKHDIEHGVLMIMQDDMLVIDIDDEELALKYEQLYPFLKNTAIQKTKKGRHYFLKRTHKCDQIRLFDGARQINGELGKLPIDIKTKCSTGTGGCIAVCPSKNKSWLKPLYDFTFDTLPHIPDDFVDHIVDKRTHTTKDTPTKSHNKKQQKSTSAPKTPLNILEVQELVDMLSQKRSENYTDWINVAWCLQNIYKQYHLYKPSDTYIHQEPSPEQELFRMFGKFSQLCPAKYSKDACIKAWDTHCRDGLRFGSLHMWAKQDNPTQYKLYKENTNENMVLRCRTQHYYVAREFYRYVNDTFVYVGSDRWYYFDGTLWKEDIERSRIKLCMLQDFLQDIRSVFHKKSQSCTKLEQEIALLKSEQLTAQDSNDHILLKKKKDIASNALKIANQERKHCDELINKLGDVRFNENVLRALSIYLHDHDFINNLDTKPHLLAFTNGVWDFTINAFRSATPNDKLSMSVMYPFNPEKKHDVAKKVHDYWNMLHPKTDQKDYLLKTFARQLYGDKGGNFFHFHAGYKASASNGKSTFFEVLEAALGQYVHKFGVEHITSKRDAPGRPKPEIDKWKGTRILFCSEPSKDDRINSGILKEFTGGEKIQYRLLYLNGIYEFVPMFKMHLMCNSTPIIDAEDRGIQRRIRKIDYISEFQDSDQVDVSKHIYKKDEGIVSNFIQDTDFKMEFLRLLLENFDQNYEFKKCRSIIESTQELFQDNDPVRAFVESWIVPTPNKYLPMKDIKDYYKISEFYDPKNNVDKYVVERLLRTNIIPIKTINNKTYRNIFEGFQIQNPYHETDANV